MNVTVDERNALGLVEHNLSLYTYIVKYSNFQSVSGTSYLSHWVKEI